MNQSLDNAQFADDEDDTELTMVGDDLRDAIEAIAEAYLDNPPWLSTGLADLDRKIGGLHPGDLIVIGGRPSMGKTALALGIAAGIARREPSIQPDVGEEERGNAAPPLGYAVYFSPQMTSQQLGLRLCAMDGKVSFQDLYRGDIDAAQFGRTRDAAMELQDARLHIDDRPGITIDQIEKRANKIRLERGLDLIVVDCLQQVVGPPWTRDNRTHELSEIVRRLKALAKALKVPVLAVSNLNRQVEDRPDHRPRLTDLRNCGEIEDIADLVLFAYRKAVDRAREEPREGTPEHLTWQEDMDRLWRRAELILAKNRHGSNTTLYVGFNDETMKFSNRE